MADPLPVLTAATPVKTATYFLNTAGGGGLETVTTIAIPNNTAVRVEVDAIGFASNDTSGIAAVKCIATVLNLGGVYSIPLDPIPEMRHGPTKLFVSIDATSGARIRAGYDGTSDSVWQVAVSWQTIPLL